MIDVVGLETLAFSWELPLETTQNDILYYTIECVPHFQHAIMEIVNNGMTAVLEEFLPGTSYTCTVTATTDDGLGAPATQTATTEEGEV